MNQMEPTAMTNLSTPSVSHPGTGQVKARKSERFFLKQGFVAFSSSNFCEIRNISKTGIGLQYLAHKGSDCAEMNEINILNNLEGFLLGQISCRIAYVSDIVPSGQHGQSVIRRIGLQFINVSQDQQEQIDDMLARFTTEKDTFH